MAYIRTVKTASGARAVQIVHSSRKGSRDIVHIGSAHGDVDLELLKTVARQRITAGQDELDLGLDAGPEAGGPLPITASRMGKRRLPVDSTEGWRELLPRPAPGTRGWGLRGWCPTT